MNEDSTTSSEIQTVSGCNDKNNMSAVDNLIFHLKTQFPNAWIYCLDFVK